MNRAKLVNRYGLELSYISSIPEMCSYIIVVCHGFNGAKENSGNIYNFTSRLNNLGLGVFAFDFTGSGQSEGLFSEISLSRQVDDLIDVIGFVSKEFIKPIAVLGRSFGGSTAIAASAHLSLVDTYILWSTPIYLTETFAVFMNNDAENNYIDLEINDIKQLYRNLTRDFARHDLIKCLAYMQNKNVLAISGTADEVVNVNNIKAIKSNLPEATVYEVEAADHRFTEHIAIREDLTLSWLKSVLLLA